MYINREVFEEMRKDVKKIQRLLGGITQKVEQENPKFVGRENSKSKAIFTTRKKMMKKIEEFTQFLKQKKIPMDKLI